MSRGFDIQTLKGLAQDSRAVKKGYLFAALPGGKTDGRMFIADAVRNGATVILAPEKTAWPENIPQKGITFVTDQNPRRALALLAAEFYGRQPQRVVAVTGTNGKTSTVHFTRQLWDARGIRAASIGTLGVSVGGVRGPGLVRSGSMTTPDPVALHAELADLAAAGITHLAIEASSHGLHQCRLDGLKVGAAAFTNLTRDHLDYHGDMDSYHEAKRRLFSEILQEGGTAVLNADLPEFGPLKKTAAARGRRVLSFGRKGADLKILKAEPSAGGQDLKIEVMGKTHELTLPMVGGFQAMNALCALGLAISENPDDEKTVAEYVSALPRLHGAPGRLQLVGGHPAGAAIYIDYAHTPDAIETALKALRPHTGKKLVCLFGCGGDRDRGKRPLMGKIASELADVVIVTDDNPRSEDPAKIRKSILEAAPRAKEIPGRREAIRAAIKGLGKDDVLLIAGKGHEQGQIFGDRTDPFDDCDESMKAIQEIRR